MRIYLDNCCYNRPYDDQSQFRIYLETQAKLHIQDIVKKGHVELVTSYILEYENEKNRLQRKKAMIRDFMNENEAYYVGKEKDDEVIKLAEPIMKTGVKEKDAYHVACAVLAGCRYFITTDDRLLKYISEQISLVTPGEFIRRLEANK